MYLDTQKQKLLRLPHFSLALLLAIVCVLISSGSFAVAQEVSRFQDTYEIDEVGNARITRRLQLSARNFAEVQQSSLEPLDVMKSVSSMTDWHEFKVIDAKFDSRTKSVVVELMQQGFVKTIGEGLWEMNSRSKPGALELITCQADRVILHGADITGWGPVSATIHVKPPQKRPRSTF